jgi:hypothetical protein
MSIERYYAVDRIEGITAVLVDDEGRTASVPIDRLPEGLEEGVVLRVAFETENVPNWSRATIDQVETDRRLVEAEKLLEELEERDPGGNVEL